MTNGTKTHGSSTPLATQSGAGFTQSEFGTRTWSGADYPRAPLTYHVVDRSKTTTYIDVWKGNVRVKQKYKPKFIIRPLRPPKRGRTEEHAYTMSDISMTDGLLKYRQPIWDVAYTGTGRNTGFFGGNAIDNWSTNNDLALLGKLREKVAGSDFNAGVFLGEGKEALNMITDSATRLYKAYRSARSGNLIKAQRYLLNGSRHEVEPPKVLASNWLQLQYGWLPLLKDLENGAQFLAHHLSVPLQQVVRVSAQVANTVQSASPSNTAPMSSKAYTRKWIKCILKEKDIVTLSGLTDPLSVAWELVPYSFVIDWFIPIGNYLSARGLSQSLSGTFVTSSKRYLMMEGIKSVNVTLAVIPGKHKLTSVNFSRTVSTSLQVPLPSVKPLSKVVSWNRAANAAALLTQLR